MWFLGCTDAYFVSDEVEPVATTLIKIAVPREEVLYLPASQ